MRGVSKDRGVHAEAQEGVKEVNSFLQRAPSHSVPEELVKQRRVELVQAVEAVLSLQSQVVPLGPRDPIPTTLGTP